MDKFNDRLLEELIIKIPTVLSTSLGIVIVCFGWPLYEIKPKIFVLNDQNLIFVFVLSSHIFTLNKFYRQI